MFTIIGGDGKEYGPVSAQELRGWIAAGRADLETQTRRLGEAEWKRLGDQNEFGPDAPPPLPSADPLADPSNRLGGFALDGVFSSLAILPGFVMFMTSVVALTANDPGRPPSVDQVLSGRSLAGLTVMGIGLLAIVLIQAVMLSRSGQTLGKRLLRMRIVRLNDEPAGFVHAFLLRSVVPMLISCIPFGIGIAFFLIDSSLIFRRDRRCLHDLMAGTKVVKC